MAAPLGLFDRVLGAVSPGALARRIEARVRVRAMTEALGAYDGASGGWRTAGRSVSRADANAEIKVSLPRLRDVCSDLVRNNPYAARAVGSRVVNTVGAGIVPSIISTSKRAKTQVAEMIRDHLESTAIDFDGNTNLYGLQASLERARSERGEALVLRHIPSSAEMREKGLKVPLQLRVLEGDYLDHRKHGWSGDHYIFMGVEFDASGNRVAYWLFDQHPNSVERHRRGAMTSRRVPASEVIHYFHVLRPGQVRGIPDGTPVIMTAWDLAEYEDARLMREKIAACFSMFWTRGSTPTTMADGARAKDRAGEFAITDLAPGLIKELPAGSTVTFGQPPATQGHAEYVSATVRRIAIGYDLSYEEVSGDLTNVSFLSGRLGEIHLSRRVDQWQWHWHIPKVCHGIGVWFVQAASLVRPLPPFSLDWTPPRREMLSPKDEIPALRDAIRSGLLSRQEAVRRLGDDPARTDEEIAEDNARSDGLGNQYDSDGRRPRQGPTMALVDPADPAKQDAQP